MADPTDVRIRTYTYPSMSTTQGKFKLKVAAGEFTSDQIILLHGGRSTGKTTFMKLLAGLAYSDAAESSSDVKARRFFSVTRLPQVVARPSMPATVRHYFIVNTWSFCSCSWFVSLVMTPLGIEQLMDQPIMDISDADYQKVVLVLLLARDVAVFLLDEPTKHLNSEEHALVSQVIRSYIRFTKKTTFVVERDVRTARDLADKVIVFEGTPSVDCVASAPYRP